MCPLMFHQSQNCNNKTHGNCTRFVRGNVLEQNYNQYLFKKLFYSFTTNNILNTTIIIIINFVR